jgi:hypothetical protein
MFEVYLTGGRIIVLKQVFIYFSNAKIIIKHVCAFSYFAMHVVYVWICLNYGD